MSGAGVVRWAVDHIEEWEILCGLRTASEERNWELFEMLQQEDFHELKQLMAARVYGQMPAELERTEPDKIMRPSDKCKEIVKNDSHCLKKTTFA